MGSALMSDSASRSRREAQALLLEPPPREESDGWMLGYLDLLTLLLVLFVLLLSLREASVDPSLEASFTGGPTVMISPLVLESLVPPVESTAQEAPSLEMAALLPRLLTVPPAMPDWQMVPAPQATAEVARSWSEIVDTDVVETSVVETDIVETEAALTLAAAMAPRVAPPPEPNIEAALAVARGPSAMETQLAGIEGVQVSRERERTILRIEDRLLFPSADVEIAESGNQLLDRLLPSLVDFDGEISVEGHTDSRTITTERFPSNWELAAARASVVLRYLSRNGVDAEKLRAIGYGPTRPLASNDSEAGRAQNRRVELVLSPHEDATEMDLATP